MNTKAVHILIDSEALAKLVEATNAMVTEWKKIYEELERVVENFKEIMGEILENVEIKKPTKYKPCLKTSARAAPKLAAKLWRKNRALFRPYKRKF